VAEQFAGGGVDDADVAVGDEEDGGGSGVGSPEADGVESAVVVVDEGVELAWSWARVRGWSGRAASQRLRVW
jgi:hypothetical protein